MKSGLFMGVSIGFAVLIMVFAGTPVTAIGPGFVQGNTGIGNPFPPPLANPDPYWWAAPNWPGGGGWSLVWDHPDVNTGMWMTGISYWDVWYRDFNIVPPPPFTYYIKEMTIPWVGLQYAGGPMTYYEHADVGGNPVNHLIWNGVFNWWVINFPGYYESQNQPFVYTQLEAWYDLDLTGDGLPEWTFAERIELAGGMPGGGGNPPNGFVCMQINPVVWPWVDINGNGIEDPAEWGSYVLPNGQLMQLQTLEYGFLFDADVNGAANNICMWNGGGWVPVNNEAGPLNGFLLNPQWFCAYITNPVTGQTVYMQPIDWWSPNPPWNKFYTCNYYCVAASGNEYSQNPAAYVNGQNLVGADGLFWYTEDWNIAGNDPWRRNIPPTYGQGWSGVVFCNFT